MSKAIDQLKSLPSAGQLKMEEGQGFELFSTAILPSPTLIMIGGVHIAIALAHIARTVQFKSVIIDPRRVFGSELRFSQADQLIQAYPGKAFEDIDITANTAIASLSHDPKIDDPALMAALGSPAFYIGALGSGKTQSKRLRRLSKLSVPEKALQRIRGPIGLDIGAVTPATEQPRHQTAAASAATEFITIRGAQGGADFSVGEFRYGYFLALG